MGRWQQGSSAQRAERWQSCVRWTVEVCVGQDLWPETGNQCQQVPGCQQKHDVANVWTGTWGVLSVLGPGLRSPATLCSHALDDQMPFHRCKWQKTKNKPVASSCRLLRKATACRKKLGGGGDGRWVTQICLWPYESPEWTLGTQVVFWGKEGFFSVSTSK